MSFLCLVPAGLDFSGLPGKPRPGFLVQAFQLLGDPPAHFGST